MKTSSVLYLHQRFFLQVPKLLDSVIVQFFQLLADLDSLNPILIRNIK